MGLPVNPNNKPGGGSFPVFTGAERPSVKAYKWQRNIDGSDQWIVAIQFDFSNAAGMSLLTDASGNQFRSFVVDFTTLVQNVVLPQFRSLFVSIDFDPTLILPAPTRPLQIADNSIGQLWYIGNDAISAQGANPGEYVTKSAKATAIFPVFMRPGNQVIFSKAKDVDNNFHGAGVAFFTTFELPPMYASMLG